MSYEEEVFDYIAEQLLLNGALQVDDIDRDTAIMHDVGIFGTDVYEFLVAFQDKYAIDFDGFEFDKFILPETFYNNPFNFWPGQTAKKMARKPRITMDHLLKVCERQKWFDPE